jgi:hypothetical protein
VSVEISDLCFFARRNECKEAATINVQCKVEGTAIHFCAKHWQEWMSRAAGDANLQAHCPRCAPAYIDRRNAQAFNNSIVIAEEPITGPLADSIDHAMHAEGILEPTRLRILRRLAADTDAYVAAVMSKSAGAVV